jgi:hypothetical protein
VRSPITRRNCACCTGPTAAGADEWQAAHLAGYEGAQPVRFGNAAAGQLQLDVYGEVLGALYHAPARTAARRRRVAARTAAARASRDDLARARRRIWEVRSGRHRFTSSKVMVWAAIESASNSARVRPSRAARRLAALGRRSTRDVLAHGYHARLGRFVDRYDGDGLDASLLLIPLTGMLDASDRGSRRPSPRSKRELLVDGLPLRYRSSHFADGCEGDEGALVAAGFWLAQVYGMQRRDADARALFERLLALRNDVGLLAEEYDVDARRMCGNFPFTLAHVGLVNAALALQRDEGATAIVADAAASIRRRAPSAAAYAYDSPLCPSPPRSPLPGSTADNTCRAVSTITFASRGSPFTSACAKCFACCSVTCGGSGGTSGSLFTSSTTGRSDASASSHAAPSCSGSST